LTPYLLVFYIHLFVLNIRTTDIIVSVVFSWYIGSSTNITDRHY